MKQDIISEKVIDLLPKGVKIYPAKTAWEAISNGLVNIQQAMKYRETETAPDARSAENGRRHVITSNDVEEIVEYIKLTINNCLSATLPHLMLEETKTYKNMKKNVVKINENTLRQIIREAVEGAIQQQVPQQQPVQQVQQQQTDLHSLTSQQLFQQLNAAKQQNNQQLVQKILQTLENSGEYMTCPVELAPFLQGNTGRNGLPADWSKINVNQLQQIRQIVENNLKMSVPYQNSIPGYVSRMVSWLERTLYMIYRNGGFKGQAKNGLSAGQFNNTVFQPYLQSLGINH